MRRLRFDIEPDWQGFRRAGFVSQMSEEAILIPSLEVITQRKGLKRARPDAGLLQMFAVR